ncbi:MAG TPA: 50S ribosomal protein L24 [Dehalococcoidia bacterium]|nr:50S ribosomal protein L24 [Dehalococcoidia bacterium]
MNKIKKDDQVMVIRGKDKGKSAQVRQVLPMEHRALVTGVNMVKRHQRQQSAQQPGGIIEKEAPIQLSNLKLICKNCGDATRVGIRQRPDGVRVRVCKKCNEDID